MSIFHFREKRTCVRLQCHQEICKKVGVFGQSSNEFHHVKNSDISPPNQESIGFEELLLRILFPENNQLRDLLCTECIAAATTLKASMAGGMSVEEIENLVIAVCTDLNLFPHDVCDGMVKLEGESVLYILNTTEYDLETCCGVMLGGHCNKRELKTWTFPIPGDKPEIEDPEPVLPPASTIKILHITDTHTDLQYEEGSATNCDYPLCCRHAFGDPEPGDPTAGHWGGEDHCDIPLRTMEELIRQASLLEPDLVYVTGDIPAHNVWEQTHESNIESINATMRLLQKYMPDTPVLNCLGNHAAAPVNSFAIPAVYDAGFNMDWLYKAMVDIWSYWLPEETFDDILKGGFFSYSPFPGFRVISVNMNYCNHENWWLLLDNVDPAQHLQWLIDTLGAAEAAGEKVHLLAHIQPGGSCDDSWNIALNNIITRYESTVRAMFHGHSHVESLVLVYDPLETLRPVAVGFKGPEGSSGGHHQPAFKMYTVDGGHSDATWSVINMQTYTMNMTEANKEGGVPEFVQRYTSQDAYKVDTLTAPSVDQMTLDMAADKDLFAQYVRNQYNHYLEPEEMGTCANDPSCHKSKLCGIVNTDQHIRDACERIELIIDEGQVNSKKQN